MNETELDIFMKKVNKKPLPKKWNEYINNIIIKNNVIYKQNSICQCTNCNQKFATGNIKIGHIAVCPHCNNQYTVMGNYLFYRGISFEKSILLCQRINKQIVIRVFEVYTYFDRKVFQMKSSTQEYARIIAGIGTFLSDATFFFRGRQYIYHDVKNSHWRKYEGERSYATYDAYPYNQTKLIKNTNLEYAPIKEFLKENRQYNYLQAVCLASYPSFEVMWKSGLKKLSEYAHLFPQTGSFQKIFKISKNLLPFMVKNNIDYREYQVLKIINEPNINALKTFKYTNLNTLKKFSKKIRITKHIDTCLELLKVQKKDLDCVLQYAKLNKLIKYKQLINNFSIYKDYLEFIEKLGFDMKDSKYLFPKNLIEAHDKFESELAVNENIEVVTKIYERFLDLSHYTYENDTYIIYPAPDFESFSQESRMQQNCVRQYSERYASNETEIYFMRNKNNIQESLVTVEYKNGKIIQQQQKCHTHTTEEQSAFLDKWLKFRNKKRKIIFEKSERTLFVA